MTISTYRIENLRFYPNLGRNCKSKGKIGKGKATGFALPLGSRKGEDSLVDRILGVSFFHVIALVSLHLCIVSP